MEKKKENILSVLFKVGKTNNRIGMTIDIPDNAGGLKCAFRVIAVKVQAGLN